jgi:predicted small metal-binding protein
MKEFRCGDLIPACAATFHSESEEEIFRQIAAHARNEHGVDEVPSEVIDQIRAGITEQPTHVQHSYTPARRPFGSTFAR